MPNTSAARPTRPENKDFIYADEAKQLLHAERYSLRHGARIRFALPGNAACVTWYAKERGVGKIIVRKDFIAVSLKAHGLPVPPDLTVPEHQSTIIYE